MPHKTSIYQSPKLLWFLQISYTCVILLSNWFDIRLIKIFGIETDAGTLIFPFTFLLSDLITEVYGYKFARRVIWIGFLFNFIFIVYGQLIVNLPSPDYAIINNQNFDSMIDLSMRIIIASTISYLFAEPLNSYIMAQLKIHTKGKYMALRFISSTFIASFFDSLIFGSIAFYKVIPNAKLFSFILHLWLIKITIEIIGVVFSLKLAKILKRIEKLDIYDIKTNFNLFKLEAIYRSDNNRYHHN